MLFADVVENAGEGLIKAAPIWGPLVILMGAAIIWLIRLLLKAHEARIGATDVFAEKLERSNEKDRGQQAEQAKVITSMAEAVKDLTREQTQGNKTLGELVTAHNTTIRDAVRGRRGNVSADDTPIVHRRTGDRERT